MSLVFKLTDPVKLRVFTEDIFKAIGCSDEHAKMAADVLLLADLRGIDSHGVARLSGYVRLWEAGRVNPRPNMKITRETPSTATLDGDQGLGLITAQKGMEIALEKSNKCGSGWVAISNSNHFGIAAYHALKATAIDQIGMALTNASPLVAPTFSKERMLGTNPICYTIPAGKHKPVVIDMATSTAANGKLQIAEREGQSIPSGWVQDSDGHISNNPAELKNGGSLLTLGSKRSTGGHKGFALSAWVDIMSGVLSGANYGPWVPPFVSFLPLAENMPGKGIGHFVGAMRVDGFREVESFKKDMDQWIDRFKSAAPTEAGTGVIIPGEPETEFHLKRSVEGIPVIESVYTTLNNLATKFKVNFDLLK
jgi:LDH2 family malate/lactate/ureidoglycolate dehydrogenase